MDYLITHGARHAWFRLRWLSDIDRMIRNGMDYERLIKLFYRNGSHNLGGQALLLASTFFWERRCRIFSNRCIRAENPASWPLRPPFFYAE